MLFNKPLFKQAVQRRFLLRAAASGLVLLQMPGRMQAATLSIGAYLAAAAPEQDGPNGELVQIRAIGFGEGGAAALAHVAKYPVPGLSFLQVESATALAGSFKRTITKALDGAQTVVCWLVKTKALKSAKRYNWAEKLKIRVY